MKQNVLLFRTKCPKGFQRPVLNFENNMTRKLSLYIRLNVNSHLLEKNFIIYRSNLSKYISYLS